MAIYGKQYWLRGAIKRRLVLLEARGSKVASDGDRKGGNVIKQMAESKNSNIPSYSRVYRQTSYFTPNVAHKLD